MASTMWYYSGIYQVRTRHQLLLRYANFMLILLRRWICHNFVLRNLYTVATSLRIGISS